MRARDQARTAKRSSSIRGDSEDVFSHGFICPKGFALKELHADPDRVRTPLIRRPDGSFAAASWDEAFALIDERLSPILAADRNAVAVYLGNPNAHNLSTPCCTAGCCCARSAPATSTRRAPSTSSPSRWRSALMFGTGTTVPVPDLDRTDYLLMLGANPLQSNGSLMTAPDMRGRLRAMRARGGKLVVIDPRRTRTAEEADEHHFIRPGTDAHFLFALVHVLFEEGLADPGERLEQLADGPRRGPASSPSRSRRRPCAGYCGIDADEIRRIARELAAAPQRRRLRPDRHLHPGVRDARELARRRAQLPDRQPRPRGRRDVPARRGGPRQRRRRRRARDAVRGSAAGRAASAAWTRSSASCPAACLAEEIDTPGEGQIRALITISGNPVVSTPNSGRLDAALGELDFMVALDVYVNETTRHADVILPAPSPLRRSHYDLALYLFAVRNVAHYSPPVLPPEPDLPDEWVTLLRLTGDRRRARPGRRRRRDRRAGRAGGDRARDRRPRSRRSRAARSTRCWPSSSRGSAPSGCST